VSQVLDVYSDDEAVTILALNLHSTVLPLNFLVCDHPVPKKATLAPPSRLTALKEEDVIDRGDNR
jgi:hypothetical protein